MASQVDERRSEQPQATSPAEDSGSQPESTGDERIPTMLDRLWRDRRIGFAVAGAVAAAWGLIAAWWTPRGPLVTTEVLAAMVIGLLVGGVAGLASRSRWAMLTSPLAFVVVFELARIGVDGPTVDAPVLSEYGLFALISGRGFHGLVALFPMVLGAATGAGLARRLSQPADARRRPGAGAVLRRSAAVLAGVALVGLAALVARPASTAPILGDDGEPLDGSIAELTTVEVNGKDLGMMIRGSDTDNPVVLFLAGGPGGSERGAMRNHPEALESHFTVATWDQRGTGTSYPALDPTSTLTIDGQVDDTISVTNYLRERFGQDQIYLMGQSWGTTLGVLAIQEAPELYRAYIGTGQMVSQRATDRIYYEDTLTWAAENGDAALVERLEDIGPPPYDRMLDYETSLAFEHEIYPYDHSPNSEGEGGFSENLIVGEYTFTDQVHLLGAFMDTFSVLYPQLQDIDFRQTATEFDLPMFFVQGANEAGGRTVLFEEWYPMVDAPVKDLGVLETSGHRPLFEQPDEFVEYMTDTVLQQAPPAGT